MTGQDPFDRIRTYLDIAQAAFEEIVDTYTPKPAQGESFEDVEAALDALGVDKPAPEAEPEPAGDLWEIAIRDTYNSVVEVRADKVQFGIVGLDSQDIGFTAYLDGSEVFHAPAGAYHYARKVSEK